MGGPGVNANGNLTTTGGNLIATGTVLIKTGDVVSVSDISSIKADPSGDGTLATTDSGNLQLVVGTDLQLNGFLQSLGPVFSCRSKPAARHASMAWSKHNPQ
ncbi:MAG UNVERIFIED_CONTAM: hypothetical protein LVR18_03160 [Planctomycetaceae bacterium]|jgi:hypothetical protein